MLYDFARRLQLL